MSASTVLRVKRRLEDNPQEALVILCKRIKTDTEEISPSLFVFRGTVENQDTEVKDVVPRSEKLKPSHNVNDIIDKLRKERKDVSAESRYEVVDCKRGIQDNNNDKTDRYDLVDLVQKKAEDGTDVKYAYDLYTSAKQDFDVSELNNLVSIDNCDPLIFGSYRDNGRDTPSSDDADDDDDSNDENNWRNDYPESEASSIDEEDMIRAMENAGLEDDLSSDEGEDKIYEEPADLFNEDVKRYGEAYAKYKSRVMAETGGVDSGVINNSRNFVHCTSVRELDEESVDGYKEDSDDGFYYGQEEDTDHFREQYRQDSSDEYTPD